MPVRTTDTYTWVTHSDFSDEYANRGRRTALYCNEKKVWSGWGDGCGLEIVRAIIGKRKVNAIQLVKIPEELDPKHWKKD